MTRPLVILTLAVGLSLGATSVVLARWHGEHAAGANAGDAVVETGIGHPIYALNPRDDRALAEYATDIFIGRVLGQTGDLGAPTSAPAQEVPQSQFAVEVLHAVKGEAEGVVTINQVGGLDAQARRLVLLEGTRFFALEGARCSWSFTFPRWSGIRSSPPVKATCPRTTRRSVRR